MAEHRVTQSWRWLFMPKYGVFGHVRRGIFVASDCGENRRGFTPPEAVFIPAAGPRILPKHVFILW